MFLDLANPVSGDPINMGLVGWWMPLPHNSGSSTVFDLRNRAHGTITNCTWARKGRNGAPTVEMSSSGVSYVQVTLPSISGAMTCVGQFLPRYNSGYPLIATDGGSIQFGYQSAGGSDFYYASSYWSARYTSLDTWHHLVWAYDGTNLTFYVNGISKETKTIALGTISTWYWGSTQSWGYTDMSFQGGAWYTRTLAASEIYSLYEDWMRGFPKTLRWYSKKRYGFQAAGGGGGGSTAKNLTLLGVG